MNGIKQKLEKQYIFWNLQHQYSAQYPGRQGGCGMVRTHVSCTGACTLNWGYVPVDGSGMNLWSPRPYGAPPLTHQGPEPGITAYTTTKIFIALLVI